MLTCGIVFRKFQVGGLGMKKILLGAAIALACLVSGPVSAANIVLDPSFEASSLLPAGYCNGASACGPLFPAWTFINATSGMDFGVDTSDPQSGANAAFFAGTSPGFYDTIQQTLTTTAGQFYTLSFWLDTSSDHSNADFQVFWNGTMVYDDPAGTDAAHQFPYTQITIGSLQATAGSTLLSFEGYNVPAGDSFDSVCVSSSTDCGTASAVPEPVSFALTGFGLAALGFARFRRRAS